MQAADAMDVAVEDTGILTRIYSGKAGDIVLTVRADDAESASLLCRACGAAIEAAVFRMYRERLLQHPSGMLPGREEAAG